MPITKDKIVVVVAQGTPANVTAFIADNDYELLEANEIHGVAGSDGGAVTIDVVKVTGTTAVASGTTMLTSTFNAKGTANTVVRKNRTNGGVSATATARRISRGQRIGVVYGGVTTALVTINVSLVLKALGSPSY